ncbi:MAG: hypothetical protein MZV70_19520 [Desulfobacterales bacterium]|nr:hypothetical protein [Desulfobacterales bacterium]
MKPRHSTMRGLPRPPRSIAKADESRPHRHSTRPEQRRGPRSWLASA